MTVKPRSLLAFLLVCCFALPANAQTIIHVKHDATGAQNGTSWPTAYRTIEAAFNQAPSLGYAQIWVARGTYRPVVRDQSIPRTESFRIPQLDGANLALYGGFAGAETVIPIGQTHDPRIPRLGPAASDKCAKIRARMEYELPGCSAFEVAETMPGAR